MTNGHATDPHIFPWQRDYYRPPAARDHRLSRHPVELQTVRVRGTTAAMNAFAHIRSDLFAGITVALVTIPQCMAFAAMAGLPPVMGLYAAVVMTLLTALVSSSPQLNIGPSVTISSMVFAVLVLVEPSDPQRWPAIAGLLAIVAGGFTVVAALFNAGQFVRFVSRSVLVGLTGGVALLIFGSQLAPLLGVPAARGATLIATVVSALESPQRINLAALAVGVGTGVLVLAGRRLGPRFPGAFAALVISAVCVRLVEMTGQSVELPSIGAIPLSWPRPLDPLTVPAYGSEVIVGAAAIALVGIIQTLAITRTFDERRGRRTNAKHTLFALGIGNMAAGVLNGFPGAGSFARSALNDSAGARTRMSGIIAALTIAIIVALAAPLAAHISQAAIAGLLMATAVSIVNWNELWSILARERYDRFVVLTTLLATFLVPIHWAILLGLAVSVALFLRRVSVLHLVEMVARRDGMFGEVEVGQQTGTHPITILQLEGPLFFAQTDELHDCLGAIFARRPRVVIIRMRRTHQLDFSAVAAMQRLASRYEADGGTLILCGLTLAMQGQLRDSLLGRTLGAEHLLTTTHRVFGSAHRAIEIARELVGDDAPPDVPLIRPDPHASDASTPADRDPSTMNAM